MKNMFTSTMVVCMRPCWRNCLRRAKANTAHTPTRITSWATRLLSLDSRWPRMACIVLWGGGKPYVADSLPVDIARGLVAGKVVQRLVVIQHLRAVVRAGE